MATYTITPDGYQTALDENGAPISGALIYTYVAGTLTPITTYADSIGTPNSNPIVADSAGRWVAYLTPGQSYKYLYCLPVSPIPSPTSPPSAYETADPVLGTPLANSQTVDITGTAGEALSSGIAVYLSDGSGSKTAGKWYIASSAQYYSSTIPQVGMTIAAIASGSSGTIRVAGSVTGLVGLTAGTTYYISTAGALTATAPVQARILGVADTTTSLVLQTDRAPIHDWVNDFRLTLTAATPVADASAATSIICTPMNGNRIDLPDASGNPTRVTSAEFSIAVPATTNTGYDIFCYNNAGVATLELLAWTSLTARATAIVRTTTGRLYKSGDLTRMYLGSFRTTGSSGQTETSNTKRYLSNWYNQVPLPLQKFESTASWTYATATVRQANGATSNQVETFIGVTQQVDISLLSPGATNSSGNINVSVGIGEDSTTSYVVGAFIQAPSANVVAIADRRLVKIAAIGAHTYSWNEWVQATGTTTFHANNGSSGSTITAGLSGFVMG